MDPSPTSACALRRRKVSLGVAAFLWALGGPGLAQMPQQPPPSGLPAQPQASSERENNAARALIDPRAMPPPPPTLPPTTPPIGPGHLPLELPHQMPNQP